MSAVPDDQPIRAPFAVAFLPAWPGSRGPIARLLAVLVVVLAAVPLFVALDRQDIRNDEAIYTFAAQRMAEIGDWLTPRYVATVDSDGLFLEKPPLKFWIVAGAIRLGLIGDDEFSIRVIDAVFGAVAFAYVMALGWRVGGVGCGAVALLLLLSFQPLLFLHGLRENEMESALFLAYAGGFYHVAAWGTGPVPARRRRHAYAAALFFVLGFLTKFVAALFLPVAALAGVLVSRGGTRYVAEHWKDWVGPSLVSAVLIPPWFVLQTVRHGTEFWAIILGGQVYDRFTAFVDPAHLQPWYFYFTDTWRHLHDGGAHVAVAGGLVFGIWRAWRGDGMARVLLVWWGLPFVLMSVGTSKMIHYAFPFLPPLALAAGWLFVEAARLIDRRAAGPVASLMTTLPARLRVETPRLRRATALIAVLALALAAFSWMTSEPVVVSLAGVRLFRNSSIVRPVVLAVVLLLVSGYARAATRVVVISLLMVLVPVHAWAGAIQRARTFDRPIAAVRECLHDLQDGRPELRRGVYVSDPTIPQLAIHPLFYNLRHAGPWVAGMERYESEVATRLATAGAEAALLMSPEQWREERDRRWPPPEGLGGSTTTPQPPDAVVISPGVVLVLPGPFGVCAPGALAAGGTAAD